MDERQRFGRNGAAAIFDQIDHRNRSDFKQACIEAQKGRHLWVCRAERLAGVHEDCLSLVIRTSSVAEAGERDTRVAFPGGGSRA